MDQSLKPTSPHSQGIRKRPPGTIKAARRRRMRLAWSVWFMAALFVFFQFYLQLSSGQMVGALMKSFSLTPMGGGFLASTYYYVYVLLQAPAGMLMDRYGPRLLLSVAAAVVSVSAFLFGAAHSVFVAAMARVLMGTGAAFAFVGCLNLIAKWFPMRRFAFMAAIVEAAGMLGAIIGSLWLADFISRVGWRDCMLFTGVAAAVLSICLWLVIRNAPRKRLIRATPNASDLWVGVKRLLKSRATWINGLYGAFLFSIVTVFTALWAIPFFEQAHHFSLVEATLVASSVYVGVMLGGPLCGWLDARYPCRRWLLILSAFLGACVLFVVIFDLMLPVWLLVLLLFVVGFLTSAYVLVFAVANELAIPTNRATSIGLANMMCVGSAPILQPVIGYLMRMHQHSYSAHSTVNLWHFQWAMSLIPFLLLVGSVLAVFLPERKRGFAKRKTF